MAPSPLNVGIVGAGANSIRHHLPNLAAQPDVELVAVCNRTVESSHRVAKDWDIPRVIADWRDLVNSDDIDAVVIGTWPNLHHPVTMAALAADKHVLCEARMAMDSSEAREMLAASRSRPHLVAQLVPSPLSFHVDATIQHMVAGGYLGKLISIEVEARSGSFPDPSEPLDWRKDAQFSGLNTMSLGIWYESLMRWVGEAESVMAAGEVVVARRPDASGEMRDVSIPDHVDVLAKMTCGAQARFQVSEVLGLAPASRATLFGTEGVVRFDDGDLLGGKRGGDGLSRIEIPEERRGHWQAEEDFVASIREGRPVLLTDFATGVKYMDFTEAVWKSMNTGASVTLPPA